MTRTRLAKIGKFGNKKVVSAFVPKGKQFSLKDLKRTIKGDYDKDYAKKKTKTNAKLYITSKQGISEKEVYYLAGSNLCFVNSIKMLSGRNYLVSIGFKDYRNLLKLMQVKKSYHNHEIQIRRVFKSMQLKKKRKIEPKQSFLIEVITGIEGLIKKPVDVKVVGDGEWGKALTKRWQETLDHPEKYQEMGITPNVDITKDGKLRFHIVKSYGYIITFFESNIDKLVA